MARKDSTQKNDRRRFLTGVVAAGAATAMAPTAALAQEPAGAGQSAAPHVPSALPPNAQIAAAETGNPGEGNGEQSRIKGVAGSDFMVDVIKTLNIKYLPANCASSFRGIHESLDRKSTRLNSSHTVISYAVFCLKKK